MPLLGFSDNHHVGAVAFGRSRIHVRPLAPLWSISCSYSPRNIRTCSPYRGVVVVHLEVGVGSGQVADFLVDGMQLVAFLLCSPRAGIRAAAHGRLQFGCVQEFLVERSQEGFQTRERGGHEAVVQHHLGDDDDVDAVVSHVRLGDDVFEIDNSKNSGDDDSENVLALRADSE